MSSVIATVRLQSTGERGFEIRFEFPTTGEEVHLPLPDRAIVVDAQRKAGRYFTSFVGRATQLGGTPQQALAALAALHDDGYELARLLAGGDHERVFALEGAFQRAWPLWQDSADWYDLSVPVPIIEVIDTGTTFPIEQLPLFDVGSIPEFASFDTVTQVAARFLGFTAVVHRSTAAATRGDSVLRNTPALPIQFLRHSKLPSAALEHQFIARLEPHVTVDGPWPQTEDAQTVHDRLTRALYDGSGLDSSPPQEPPVQIQHFSCHCDTTALSDDDYMIKLSTRRGQSRDVTFHELKKAFNKHIRADRNTSAARPVVVLNACASSRTDPHSAYSFPRWFLDCGHRAFIGTETDVPDAVAAEFSSALYGRVVEGYPLGEAVVRARRDLLRDSQSPLGVLYVMYGNIELAIEHPRPRAYRGY